MILSLHKLLTYGIGGKFYSIIASIYENYVLQIIGSAMLSDKYLATGGVKQGDNLSPNIFNLYLNDIVDVLHKEVYDPVKLSSTNFNCLLYADDIILLHESETGLQKCLDKLSQYCESWCLNVNYEKKQSYDFFIKQVDFMEIQTITLIIFNFKLLESISI